MNSNIQIKNHSIVFDSVTDWNRIWKQIQAEHGKSINISFVLKRELGFTIRTHQHWNTVKTNSGKLKEMFCEQIHLDFYNESMKSWFILRYLNNEQAQ